MATVLMSSDDEPPSLSLSQTEKKNLKSLQPRGQTSKVKRITNGIMRLFPRRREKEIRGALEELLEVGVRPLDEQELGFGGDQRSMLFNVLNLNEIKAEDVAVPRIDIEAVEVSATYEELMESFLEHQHSRLPVYEENLDHTLGFIHIKDLVKAYKDPDTFDLRQVLHEPLYVSPAMQASDLLLRMRLSRTHLALMVDEFGGVDGLITIEDLVEEIVGDIEDEHDQDSDVPKLRETGQGWTADARLTIEELEANLGSVLTGEEREEDLDTLGGLLMFLAGSVPTKGQVLQHEGSGLEFRVLEADPRRVINVRVVRPKKRGA